jgi:Mn2+/Fe2+ NRAMP family transporter
MHGALAVLIAQSTSEGEVALIGLAGTVVTAIAAIAAARFSARDEDGATQTISSISEHVGQLDARVKALEEHAKTG